jgi:hypothetical protein
MASLTAQLFDDAKFFDEQQLEADVESFLQRYTEGAHVVGDPALRARNDLDSEVRLYEQLLQQVREREFRPANAPKASNAKALDNGAIAEIHRSREYVRRMREETTEFRRVAEARKRLDALRLGIAKREQTIDRLMQTSGEFDVRAHATKQIAELQAAVQADRQELISLIDDLKEDDSFEALVASLREVNYHPVQGDTAKAKFWIICRLDRVRPTLPASLRIRDLCLMLMLVSWVQHQKLETILFASQATSNTPSTSGWIYLGISTRDAPPLRYKRTDHAVGSEVMDGRFLCSLTVDDLQLARY